MKIVLFLLLITYIFTVDATTATLDLTQGQSLTVGTAGTVKITVIANGDMTLKSLTNLVLKKNEDTISIELTCTFEEAYSFADEALTKEVTCSTNAPQSAGTYKLAAAASATIGGTSDGSNPITGVTFSIANEPNSLSITQTVVEEDPCDGKEQTACTGTCTWNSATSKCVTADVQEDPCNGKEQTACTGTCTWNSATSKCVTAGSDTGSNSGSSTNQGSGSGTDEGSGSDSSGFLKLSVFICLFVLFL